MRSKPKRSKKKKSSWLINLLLVLLFVVGLALVFNTQIRNFLIKKNGESYAVSTLTSADIANNLNENASFDFDAVESLSTEAVLKAQLANKKLPVIGGIAVPDLKINLPIFKGLDNAALLFGAGTMKPEQEMGALNNYALASHRVQDMVSLFSPLEYAKVDQVIYLTDLTNIYTYKITLVEKIDPTQTEFINNVPDKKLLTLITCGDMDATTRIVVQAELSDTTKVEDADNQMRDAFNMEQKTL